MRLFVLGANWIRLEYWQNTFLLFFGIFIHPHHTSVKLYTYICSMYYRISYIVGIASISNALRVRSSPEVRRQLPLSPLYFNPIKYCVLFASFCP